MRIIAHSAFTPHEELAEPPRLLDLSEYRLDDLLAQTVAAAMAGTPEPGGRPGEERAGLPGRFAVAVLLPCFCRSVAM